MVIEKLPVVAMFESDGKREAVLRIGESEGRAIYSFTVLTPFLRRMGDQDDNAVSLLLNGKWENFTVSGKSTCPALIKTEILENNNKRSRYRITITLDGAVPSSLDAKAEGLSISV